MRPPILVRSNAELGEAQAMFAGKEQEERRALYNEFQTGPVWASWRQETVRELRELLQEKSG